MKKELKELKSKYRAIFELGNSASIAVINEDGNITDWNTCAESTFGYDKSEVIGFPMTGLFALSRKEMSIENLFRTVNKASNSDSREVLELYGLKKCGEQFPIELEIKKGEITSSVFYIAIMVDTSIRKSLESELDKKSKELELLLYRSAHDLKAPFCSAEGLINILKEEEINPTVRGILTMLESTLDKGKQLLDDLALVSIISKKNRSVEAINFEEITIDALAALQGLDDFDSIAFDLDVKLNTQFYSNKELLSSLFKNLMRYAVNFTHFKCQDEIPDIRLIVKEYLGGIKIAIAFNALESNNESEKGIFDLNRFTSDYSLSYGGLGEYVIKNIVEILEGKLRVKTLNELGTCIEIIIPNSNKN